MLTLELLNEADRLHDEVNRLFLRGNPRQMATADAPALNAWASDHVLRVTAELPGIDPNQVDVSVQGDQLTLRGSLPERSLKEGERWVRQEHTPYTFVRSFRLPFRVESDKIEAQYANGILTLTLPRAESEKPKRIQIKAA